MLTVSKFQNQEGIRKKVWGVGWGGGWQVLYSAGLDLRGVFFRIDVDQPLYWFCSDGFFPLSAPMVFFYWKKGFYFPFETY